MIADDAVSDAALDQVIRHIGFGSVNEAADDGAAAVQFRNGIE